MGMNYLQHNLGCTETPDKETEITVRLILSLKGAAKGRPLLLANL